MKKQKRILIVDDDLSLTRMLKLNLHHTGRYAVHVENDPDRAIAAAREFSPDLILLDVMMPGQDGGDLAASFQASPALAKIPIVFLTAAVKKEEIGSRGGMIGGFTYLAKPVDLEELLDCIEKNLVK